MPTSDAAPIDSPSCFRAAVPPAHWRRWGDEVAVYEGRSAQTHLLVDGHAELFGLLAASAEPLSLDDIAREFEIDDASAAAQALSDDERAALLALVQGLVALGVVDAVPAA